MTRMTHRHDGGTVHNHVHYAMTEMPASGAIHSHDYRADWQARPAWALVGRTGWAIRRYSALTVEVAAPSGWSDAAIRYPHSGAIAYDYPERIPAYVKRAVARAYSED